jgi:hypothetical protein
VLSGEAANINFIVFGLTRTHYENPTKCVGLIQSGPHHHFIENKLFSRHDIAEKLLNWR